jgi:hypothetical protein
VTQRIFNDKKFDAVGTKNQEIQSTLIIPSGETRVIGGLVRQDRNESRSGVPGLVKLPIVGPWLFGKYNRPAEQNGRSMLLIFLTPTIISDKPTQTLKYKGRIVTRGDEDQEASLEEPAVAPTASDTWLAPIDNTEKRGTQDASQLMPRSKRRWEASEAQSGQGQVESLATPTPESSVPEPEKPEVEAESATERFQDVKRMAISETQTTGAQAMMVRLTGPSGALTGSTSTGGAASAQPAPQAAAAHAQQAAGGAQSPQPSQPGVSGPVRWTPRPSITPRSGLATPPAWGSRGNPPRPETRY